MQIGTCLNTSFLFPGSKSAGGVNEKRKGPEIRSEREKRVRRKTVSSLVELKPDLPFNNLPIFLKEMLLPTWITESLSLFLSLSALSEPVFTFRNILITVIICNVISHGALPQLFPQPTANLCNRGRASIPPPLPANALPSSPCLSSNMVPGTRLQTPVLCWVMFKDTAGVCTF